MAHLVVQAVGGFLIHDISQPPKQAHQFIEAPVHVTDDVERPMLMAQVTPERLSFDLNRVDLLRGIEDVDVAKPFAFEASHRSTHLLMLLPYYMSTEVTIRPVPVSLSAQLFGQSENDCHGDCMVITRDPN